MQKSRRRTQAGQPADIEAPEIEGGIQSLHTGEWGPATATARAIFRERGANL